ncbi:MAG: 50S ribosomal protein L3, partial [Planctomycetaceae bacterium]|nr:50S ribosomal protein L3 [Planctomycetaceae bacterium]
MGVGLLGRKVGMTQVYGPDGSIIPVTVVAAGPCTVLQVRTQDRDGYEAVQLGYGDKLSQADAERPAEQRNRSRASRAERGHVVQLSSKRQKSRQAAGVELLPKANCEPQRFVKEFRTDGETHEHTVGQVLTAAHFDGVTHVDVIGTTKGRGTEGVMFRHNFSGQKASHGAKKIHRMPGSMSAHGTNRGWCGRIKKGKRMAGRYGAERCTIRNLQLVRIDAENNMLLVRGAIPGPN